MVGIAPFGVDVSGISMPSALRFARSDVVLLDGVAVRSGGGNEVTVVGFIGGGMLGAADCTGVDCLTLAAEASISANAFESSRR